MNDNTYFEEAERLLKAIKAKLNDDTVWYHIQVEFSISAYRKKYSASMHLPNNQYLHFNAFTPEDSLADIELYLNTANDKVIRKHYYESQIRSNEVTIEALRKNLKELENE